MLLPKAISLCAYNNLFYYMCIYLQILFILNIIAKLSKMLKNYP